MVSFIHIAFPTCGFSFTAFDDLDLLQEFGLGVRLEQFEQPGQADRTGRLLIVCSEQFDRGDIPTQGHVTTRPPMDEHIHQQVHFSN